VFRTISRASLLAILSLGAYALGTGCNGDHSASPSSHQSGLGSITVALLSGGVTVNTVAYTITGPHNFNQTGSLDVSTSSTVSALIGGLPAGMGYVISLTATSTDGTTSCAGAANFGVTANTVTQVAVGLDCHQPAKTGSISINGTINVCPSIQGISALPATLAVGGTSAITSTATDIDNGPSPLTYSWTASSGTLTGANTASPTLLCTTPGAVTLTLTASDGDTTAGCAAVGTVQVTCTGHADAALLYATTTKIKHLVVVFGENISYDHYFGTYPNAANLTGETPFTATAGTPSNNNLVAPLDPTNSFMPIAGVDLLNHNPNSLNATNGTGAVNPFRLGAAQAATNDQGHNYKPEQQADDNGAMDLFPVSTGTAGPPPGSPAQAQTKGLVMAYYDGNTVSALWSWAQQFAMNDNSWSTVFGPSTPGAINLISGQTNGFATFNKDPSMMSASHVVADGATPADWTLIGDTDPVGDVCSTASDQNSFKGRNIGDLLNTQHISWGWFEGGFDLTITNTNGTTGCARSTPQTVAGATSTSADYIPHHAPFQYYASTANLTHARPSSVAAIGHSLETDNVTPEPANHSYDSHDFFDALTAGNLPAVVYLKAPAFQDGHPGYSNPVDEQNFLVQVVTALENSQEWSSTAIVLAYDDSDGWYDHQMPSIVNPSNSAADALNSAGHCQTGAQQNGPAPTTRLLGANGVAVDGRCGYGTRQPLLVISPCAKKNYIDHTLTDQTSILKFVEDNWLGGQRIQTGGSFDTIAGSIQNMFTF
jgi:phospholipase C